MDNRSSSQRNWGELISLIKEEEHFEAIIRDEITRALYIFFCAATSGKNMLRKENFSVLCNMIPV
jgi:septum formation inhibitor-activating ATPase MinD